MTETLKIGLVSLFPEMFAALDHSITGRAQKNGLLELSHWNPREFTHDKHRVVDDRPYGGGPGMVMMAQPLIDAIHAAKKSLGTESRVIYLSPQGRRLDQNGVIELSQHRALIFVAGRYEGIDQRVIDSVIDEQWSIGDYVISGGELAAMICVDTLTRQLPGALGHQDSAAQDSFAAGIFDCPHYTRPETVAGQTVPKVLLGGDHRAIENWRLKQALGQTWQQRPDLLKQKPLTAAEKSLLDEYISEYHRSKA